MGRRIACLLVALALAATLSAPAAAWADGDPASDFLLAQNVFYPFQPPVARSLQRALNAETAATRRAGLPLKVAIIASRGDLGAIPTIFGRAQAYADFLDREISFTGPQPLLVVMPDGYGVAGLRPAVGHVMPTLRLPSGHSSDDLARAAVPAVARIAAADGHPIPAAAAKTGATAAPAANSSTPMIAAALAVAAVLAAGGLLTWRRRQAARPVRRRSPARR